MLVCQVHISGQNHLDQKLFGRTHVFTQTNFPLFIFKIRVRFRWCLCHIVLKHNIETHIWHQNSSKALIWLLLQNIPFHIFGKYADMICTSLSNRNLCEWKSDDTHLHRIYFFSRMHLVKVCRSVVKVVLCKFWDCGIFTPNYNGGGPLRLYNLYM